MTHMVYTHKMLVQINEDRSKENSKVTDSEPGPARAWPPSLMLGSHSKAGRGGEVSREEGTGSSVPLWRQLAQEAGGDRQEGGPSM